MSAQQLSQLQSQFGFEQFRPGQAQTVNQLLNGHSSLAIFPTGSGKSLCYQFTALQLPHLTLVISPLLALMKDQLEFLARKNIAAASLDSTLNYQQQQQTMADIKAGNIKILMVSVERFKNERFRQFISQIPISMLVVDEAHCISEWGHNFRPDYLKLPQYQQQLNIPLVLLLTATATKKVKRDMAAKFAINEKHIVQTGFYRPNLNLSVKGVEQSSKNQQLLATINQQQGAGIVYVTLQQTAEHVAEFLQQHNLNAAAYHAGLADDIRQTIQQDFMRNQVDIVVATIAFGMGVDKANIRFVIHYDLPKSIENYSQEIGRAGRDGQASNCLTLANLDGLNTVENFVYGDTPEPSGINTLLDDIQQNSPNDNWEMQLYNLSTRTNIRQLTLKTILVQLELQNVLQAQYSYFAEYKIKCLVDTQTIVANFKDERQQFIQAIFAATTFKKIWGVINFDLLQQTYPSDRKRVLTALEYLQQKNLIELQASGMTEVYQVNPSNLQAPNLAQQLADYFSQKEQSEIKRIATLVRFFELDSCLSYNLARYFDDQQAPSQCGHCSVCQGQIAKLPLAPTPPLPSLETLAQVKNTLQNAIQAIDHNIVVSHELTCRFLCGLTQPIFTKIKARNLQGWASCEKQRYAEVKQLLMSL
ncbi:RecQ family ATP-dependent DNA helicase [Saccharobesus litoralis]|uniref:RecQ family ATP-dependent DNA helicase n=1 Tax=Saccharobesus litoralis TaxID=2172099 RepID=UPI0038B596E6